VNGGGVALLECDASHFMIDWTNSDEFEIHPLRCKSAADSIFSTTTAYSNPFLTELAELK
jgi:hypothetical protein